LKYWEQAALEMIAAGQPITSEGLRKLTEYFLEDCGLLPLPSVRPQLSFPKDIANDPTPSATRLQRLFNLRNVNALPAGQELHFGDQLTLIYGENGTGKTGYARPLASAGFTRGERQVLPNVATPYAGAVPQADIEIVSANSKKVITWRNGNHNRELGGVHVFDDKSIIAHLSRSNSLSFSPSGLQLLTRLADTTDLVRNEINQLIAEREKEHIFYLAFDGDSPIRQSVTALGPETNQEELETLAKLTADETQQIATLEREVAELASQNIPKKIATIQQEVKDLEKLKESLRAAENAVSDFVLAEVNVLARTFAEQQNRVREAGTSQFESDQFTHVGSKEWLDFLEAANRLANFEIAHGREYPSVGASCLLCREPLSAESVSLIERLWNFLISDVQSQLDRTQLSCSDKATALNNLRLDFFSEDLNIRRLVSEELPEIVAAVQSQVEAIETRRGEFCESLILHQVCHPAPLLNLDLSELEQITEVRKRDIQQLSDSDAGKKLSTATNALRVLKHRKILDVQLANITSYVEGRRWAVKARRSLGTTRAITTKYDELFQELVTDRYVAIFQDTLERFKKDFRVAVETRGQKGETVRQLVLKTSGSSRPYSIVEVLSEGEKRAVATSDFIAEVTLDKNCCCLVFDDPVTSLDAKWKGTIARCLAEQAQAKQVVIFTHDLAFLYHIKAHAESLGVKTVSHWVKNDENGPGFLYSDNSPVCEGDYKSANLAQKRYAEAKNAPPERQQRFLQEGFGALRTSYEAFIVFELFNGVVERFSPDISFGRLNNVRIDQDIIGEVIERMEALSRHIDAHSHSDSFAEVKPSPSDLLKEIDLFEDIRKRQKELKKASK
jgi:DnaJ-domain-containing protein 1/ABC-type histidine transport system ATPase subunit